MALSSVDSRESVFGGMTGREEIGKVLHQSDLQKLVRSCTTGTGGAKRPRALSRSEKAPGVVKKLQAQALRPLE